MLVPHDRPAVFLDLDLAKRQTTALKQIQSGSFEADSEWKRFLVGESISGSKHVCVDENVVGSRYRDQAIPLLGTISFLGGADLFLACSDQQSE